MIQGTQDHVAKRRTAKEQAKRDRMGSGSMDYKSSHNLGKQAVNVTKVTKKKMSKKLGY